MKKNLLLLFISILSQTIVGQTFPIGHRTITYNDPARTGGFGSGGGPGRQIQTEVYYPATSAGDNTPLADGSFPVVVFGHGFQMTWDVYAPIYDSLARRGYIVCMPRTEGGLSPSHTNFGQDLAIILDKTLAFNTNSASPFFGKINGKAALGGHSMGGGCSFLAAQYTTNETAIFNFAAAETNPSAVAQCSTNVTEPLLVIAGSFDVVTPPATNQDLMYNAALSQCKTYFTITGGYHCQFSNVSTQCQFGEGFSNPPSGGPSRTVQLQRTRAILNPFLDFWLKGICPAWYTLMDLYNNSPTSDYTRQQSCNVSIPTTAIIVAGGPLSFCEGGSVTLNSQPSGFTSIWSNGQSGSSINVSTSENITLTLTGSNNCSVTSSATAVDVNPLPDAQIIAQGPTSVCGGDIVVLSSSVSTGNSWSTGETSQSITVASTSTITLSVTSAEGCTGNSDSISVTVNDVLVPAIQRSSNGICGEGEVTLTLTDAAFYTNILWDDGSTSSSITVSEEGEYCATVENAQGCSGENCASIQVFQLPTSSFTLSQSTVDVGESFTIVPQSGTLTYDYGDGNTGNSVSYAYESPGEYSLCATAIDFSSFCQSTTCQTIIVLDALHNEEIEKQKDEVFYPNPASEVLFISNTLMKYDVYNSAGILIKKELTGNLDLSCLAEGLYAIVSNELSKQFYFIKRNK